MGDFSEAQKKYLKSLISGFNAKMNEKIELLETNITREKQGERSSSDAAIQILNFNQIEVESCDKSDAYSLVKKIEVLKNSAELKGTEVLLSNDLIPEVRMQQKISVGRMGVERRLGHTCRLQGPNMVIDGKFYTLGQLEGRRKNESGISGAVNDSSKEVVN
ncbi:hypothetical protein HHI36_012665 [Cryptolaemus montrouzieri]|uniref:Uncharacterized protein n=1 Tax=Cryptolaemus montrouzieri TaxID=559131 RepID=A0ABD2NFG3_9CUCU